MSKDIPQGGPVQWGPISESSLNMATPNYVFPIGRIAEILAEDEDWLQEIAMELEPEDGHITIYGTDDLSTSAFTEFGVENLRSLIEEHKRQMAQAAQKLNTK